MFVLENIMKTLKHYDCISRCKLPSALMMDKNKLFLIMLKLGRLLITVFFGNGFLPHAFPTQCMNVNLVTRKFPFLTLLVTTWTFTMTEDATFHDCSV